jgi:hypothetical protein
LWDRSLDSIGDFPRKIADFSNRALALLLQNDAALSPGCRARLFVTRFRGET